MDTGGINQLSPGTSRPDLRHHWVLAATWVIKLFPMYAGGITTPMRVRETWDWYRHEAPNADLSLLALAPAPVIYAGLIVAVLLTISLGGVLIRRTLRPLHADLE